MTRSPAKIALGLLAAALLLAAASCGGGGGGTSTTAEALTRAQFVARADAICARTQKRQLVRMNEFIKQGWDPTTGDEAALVRFAGLPPMKTQVAEFEALVPPTEMVVEVDELLTAVKRAVREGESRPARVLLISSTPFAKSQRLGAELGLAQGCGGA